MNRSTASFLENRLVNWTIPALLFVLGPLNLNLGARAEVSPTSSGTSKETQSAQPDLTQLDAFDAVQEANRKLISGDADRALELYDHAAKQEPDAREIAFGKGLGHYAKKEFDLAKNEFLKAAAGKNDGLSADAAYAAAACDHSEALGSQGDPKPALGKLEDAMRGYRDVLGAHPGHQAARDADRKAATMWRELKRQMQQQEQQSQQDKDQKKDEDQEKDENKQQQDGNKGDSQEKDNKEEQQQNADQKQDSAKDGSEQKNQQQQKSAEQQKDQQEKTEKAKESKPDSKDAQAEQDSAESQAMKEKKEEASREQAERKLREMMQAVRQRKKDRRETQQPVYVVPTDKDW